MENSGFGDFMLMKNEFGSLTVISMSLNLGGYTTQLDHCIRCGKYFSVVMKW